MNILAAILVTLFLAFIAAVLKVNREDITVEQMLENLKSQTEGITRYKEEMEAVIAEYGDELGYRAGEPDEYPPTLGDEWNTEVEDIDE